jgi:AraC family transcriptional regulator
MLNKTTTSDEGEQHDTGISDGDVLAKLIIEASGVFDTDRAKAKCCIERAVDLVRGRECLPSWQLGRPRVRGRLSGWEVQQVRHYIESNIGQRISVGELSALVRQSRGQFFRTFRKSFGESPQAYILRRRILQAELLIRNSDETLAQVALDCGLCDQAHLSRLFRRINGVSPSAWRRQVALQPMRPDAQYLGASARIWHRIRTQQGPSLESARPISNGTTRPPLTATRREMRGGCAIAPSR